jgi:hypothetical protein
MRGPELWVCGRLVWGGMSTGAKSGIEVGAIIGALSICGHLTISSLSSIRVSHIYPQNILMSIS